MITKNPEAKFVAVLLDIDDFKFVNDIVWACLWRQCIKESGRQYESFFPV